jgi:hypothetical protein
MSKREFLSAAALGITPEVHDALVKTLAVFESGEKQHGHRDTFYTRALVSYLTTGKLNLDSAIDEA